MIQYKPAYIDYLYLKESLKEYASPKAKITHMLKARKIIKIRRGLYITPDNPSMSLKTLANKIYAPSYISFEYALAYYGMIPEKVQTITSASSGKNKKKIFHTPVGDFLYQSINITAYPHGIERQEENGSPFLIAGKEKALCDTLSKAGSIISIKALQRLLFDDLRIDPGVLLTLNTRDVEFLSELYNRKAVTLFAGFLKKELSRA
jgi:hypothetical protein